jgi:uncharacterized protein YgbK (DUF1537 family)
VVDGFVDTPGRPPTAARLDGLEIVPRKGVTYRGATFTELDVAAVLAGEAVNLHARIDSALRAGGLPVLYTSRELVSASGEDGLAIGQRVTDALIGALDGLSTQPRFVIAKGGVTSHEIARRAFGARRATALGQVLPGVPVWRLEATASPLGVGIPYVVFPGNVGGADDLRRVVELLS